MISSKTQVWFKFLNTIGSAIQTKNLWNRNHDPMAILYRVEIKHKDYLYNSKIKCPLSTFIIQL